MRTSASRVMSLVGDVLTRRAVAQHGDAIGDLQRFLERVRNENDAGATLPQRVQEMEEMLHLLGRKRSGRLVENEDLGVVPNGADDLDHLPLRGAEVFDQRQAGRR